MLISEKGQVTISKNIRMAAGVLPGTEVMFSLEGGRIVITPVASHIKNDRRAALRTAAAKVRKNMEPEFQQLTAQEIMQFLRTDDEPAPNTTTKIRSTRTRRRWHIG